MEGMSINNLPIELLGHIISFLSPSERLESALISRRFAQAFNESPMNDIWLVVRAGLIDEAKAIISNSIRQYQNIRICKADLLEFNSIIWTKLGISLRRLEFNDCHYGSSEVFYSILLACPRLESLAIHDTFDASMWEQWSKLPSGISLQEIQDSTHKLSHLHLGLYVNADTLENMLVAMPKVSTISVSRFEPNSDFLDRLPEMLGTNRRITCVDWKSDMEKTELRELLRMASTSLREVRITSPLYDQGVYEELKSCTELRHLELYLNATVQNFFLQDILGKNPELEVLELLDYDTGYLFLSYEAMMPILKLTKLRELRLDLALSTRSFGSVREDFMRGLGRFLSLERLHLSLGVENGVLEHSSFQILASLPNLRDLSLNYLNWDANCLRAFLLDLKNLRRLSITSIAARGVREVSKESKLERKVLSDAIRSRSDRYGERNQSSWRKVLDSILRFRPDRRKETIESSCLETLELRYLPLTDVGLTGIAAHHSRLKILKLTGCNKITDAGFVNVLQQQPLLEELCICFSSSADGSFLEALTELCPRLRRLSFKRYSKMNRLAVKSFESRRPEVSFTHS